MRNLLVALAMGSAVVLVAAPSDAQAQRAGPNPIAVADSFYLREGDPGRALEVLRPLVVSGARESGGDPQLYDALWKAARASLTIGILAEPRRGQAEWYRLAEEYGRRAVELDSERPEGRYWLVATQGRMALRAGAVEASSLAEAVRAGAHELLERDPDHAGAHNALGRLYLAVLSLPRMYRMMGRALAGRTTFAEATWAAAEQHLARAVQLEPGMVIYRVDLARFHLARRSWDAAATDLNVAQALPVVFPADTLFQREASQLRRRIPTASR
ncbi:MAG: hypothetical protein EXR92_01195 [Gemmatimonadetes bacterium]|nr:hypothetical protein [Gemmatimonadota bacterium]